MLKPKVGLVWMKRKLFPYAPYNRMLLVVDLGSFQPLDTIRFFLEDS